LTPLIAANGDTYATSQGPITVGGYSVEAAGNSSIKNHPTVGIVSRGGTVERENYSALKLQEATELQWILNDPDFTNSTRMATVVNALLGEDTAEAVDNGTVVVKVPDRFLGRQAELVASIETLDVALDHVAKVVVNERTGTVVMGADITLSPVAIAHGGLTIEVSRDHEVSQPNILARGETREVTQTDVTVREEEGKVTLVKGATVGDVVSALNAMGVTPRDLIVILQSMQAAGGLHAEIETM
jgi:flagellar P-ring protein precursor FlgI